MDSRAKQRLTGAVILVALFVLLVPELLTGPREAPTAPGTAEEEGLRSYTIDLDAPATPATPSPAEPAVQFPTVDATPRSQPALAQPGEAAQTLPEEPEPRAETATGPATATASVPTPAPAASRPAPAASTAATPTPSRPAPAPSRPAAAAPREGQFAVQLGSFGSRENADRLMRDMTAKGFNTFIAPTTTGNGRALYRVRVGPTKDRASAEALAAQLKRMGQSGSIVPIS